MGQYNNRSKTLWFFAGASVFLAGIAALVLIFSGIGNREKPFSQEGSQAESEKKENLAESLKGQKADREDVPEESGGGTGRAIDGKGNQKEELPAGIPGEQVEAQEESYCLVSENGFLLVFAKDRSSICLDTHMPLAEFPLAEQERLLDGVWFSSMMEVFHYLESYTS